MGAETARRPLVEVHPRPMRRCRESTPPLKDHLAGKYIHRRATNVIHDKSEAELCSISRWARWITTKADRPSGQSGSTRTLLSWSKSLSTIWKSIKQPWRTPLNSSKSQKNPQILKCKKAEDCWQGADGRNVVSWRRS